MPRRQSTSSPAVSTPEKPPPMTTKWPSRRRMSASALELDARDAAQHHVADVHRVADGLERRARARARPGSRSRRARLPKASTRCSLGSIVRSPASVDARQRAARRDRRAVTRPMTKRACAQHLADRRDHLLGKHRRAERFGQHRVERRVALLADQQRARSRAAACRRARAASVVPAKPPPMIAMVLARPCGSRLTQAGLT